jgi:16S rRNA (guanine527-N7)-methyltransferase
MAARDQQDWDDLAGQLRDGARQLELSIDDTQVKQLLAYLAQLDRWNSVHSLSAWKTPADLLIHHVFDSMTLVGPLERFAKGRRLRIVDAGSGPGFPAAVLAAMRPAWSVTAVDAVAKKVAFIRQAAVGSGIANLTGLHARLEDLRPSWPFDVVVSRAFASLDTLTACTCQLLAPDGVWAAQKGRLPKEEIAHVRGEFHVFHVEPVTVPGLSAERHLVWIRKVER